MIIKRIIENTPDATLEEKAEANRLLQNVLTSTSDEIANVDHNNEVDRALDKRKNRGNCTKLIKTRCFKCNPRSI